MTRRHGVAARCGPLSLLLVSFAALVGSFGVWDWTTGVVTLGVQLALVPLAVDWAGDALRSLAHRLIPGLLAAASVGYSAWLLGGHDVVTGLTATLRILTLVLPGAVLLGYLDPSELGDCLAQQLRLPARPVVAAVGALQRLETLDQQWQQLDRARRARGLGPSRSPVARVRHLTALTFGLLVHTLRRSAHLAVAMDARGFATAHRRTWAQSPRWGRADGALAVVAMVLALLPFVVARLT